jgi:hypothetical protein
MPTGRPGASNSWRCWPLSAGHLINPQVVAILKKVVYYLVKHIEQEGM